MAEYLKEEALKTVSAELYYDLADTIDEMTEDELRTLISFNGDYAKESEMK